MGEALLETGALTEAGTSLRRALTIIEALPAAPHNPATLRSRPPLPFYRIGNLYARMAAVDGADRNTQARYWREAKAWYQKSLPLSTAAKERGYLPGRHAKIADDLIQAIARCDRALTS